MSTSTIQAFDFEAQAVRVMVRDDEPWFVAADVCRVLELTNPTVALEGLDEDERAKYYLGRQGEGNIISESGLYALIFKSRKPEAKKFRKWITSEVIPTIRQTGGYQHPQSAVRVLTPMEEVRELLLTSARAVRDKTLDVGRAQQIANLSARYLEAIKIEGDAIGYEAVLGLRAGEAGSRLLQVRRSEVDGKLQGVPQCAVPPAAAGDAELQGEALGDETPVVGNESGTREAAQSQVQREADFP